MNHTPKHYCFGVSKEKALHGLYYIFHGMHGVYSASWNHRMTIVSKFLIAATIRQN